MPSNSLQYEIHHQLSIMSWCDEVGRADGADVEKVCQAAPSYSVPIQGVDKRVGHYYY